MMAESTSSGYYALMGRDHTMRLQSRERLLMQKFDKASKTADENTLEKRVERMQARIEALDMMLQHQQEEGERSVKP